MRKLLYLFVIFTGITVFAQNPSVVEYTVTGTFANLRGGPGTNYEIVDTADEGDTLFIYDEEPEHEDWLRVWREDEEDAWIADWLVEKAPQRFYPASQEPLITASGRGKDITDIFDMPPGAYRIDATVDDNYFILDSITLDGTCRDQSLFIEGDRNVQKLILSTLFLSYGCTLIFETDNVDGDWQIEIRDLLDAEALAASILEIENGTSISGVGHQLTMATQLPTGFWSINATVQDNYFILHAHVLSGECDDTAVFIEGDSELKTLDISTLYRNNESEPCVIYWETDNVDGDWELTFEKLR